jgi:predicted transcriptional regulator
MFDQLTGNKIHHYWRTLHTMLLLNFIEQHPEGVTFYDLKQIENIPASRIYRKMRNMEEMRFLVKDEERNEIGRPKYVFKISESGKIHKKHLKEKLLNVLQLVKSKFPEQMDFDFESFLQQGTITLFKSPLQHVMENKMPFKKKIICLQEIKQDHQDMIRNIDKSIKMLKKQIGELNNDQ